MYERVFKLKEDFPDLEIFINGGIQSIDEMKALMSKEPWLDGVMIGRLAFQDPWQFAWVDSEIFEMPSSDVSWLDVLTAYREFII